MKLRKSTIVLLIVILITLLLGGIAVYTAYLIRKAKPAEKAKAAPPGFTAFCDQLSFKEEEALLQSDGKFSLKFQVSNDGVVPLTVSLRPLIFSCSHTAAGKVCSETLLTGALRDDWQEDVVIPAEDPSTPGNSIKTYEYIADTNFGTACGRVQYEVIVLDAKDGSGRIGACNLSKWALTRIVDSGKDCEPSCELIASSSQVSPGDSVSLNATVTTGGGIATSYLWTDSLASNAFVPKDAVSTTYTVPTTTADKIDIDFKVSTKVLPENISPVFGVGHNSFTDISNASRIFYLPGIGNKVNGGDRTDFYFYNPTSNSVGGTLVFYNASSGATEKTVAVSIPAKGTKRVSTSESGLFGSTPFSGNAIFTGDERSNNTVISYQKLDTSGTNRGYGLEALRESSSNTLLYHSPVSTPSLGWGTSGQYITVFNPGGAETIATLDFCYLDGTCDYSVDKTIPAHGSVTVLSSEVIPAEPPAGKCGGVAKDCWWTGYVSITAGSKVVSINEDYSSKDSRGTPNYGRATTAIYAPSDLLCLMPITHDTHGVLATGIGFSNVGVGGNTSPQSGGSIKFYDGFTGIEQDASMDISLSGGKTYHRDSSWAGGLSAPYISLPAGYHGAAIASGSELVGRIQNIGDSAHDLGRSTTGIDCSPSALSSKVHLSDILYAAYGTRTTSIQVFNPSGTANVNASVNFFDSTGNQTGSYDMYLKPHAMGEVLANWVVPPQWYGSVTVTGDGSVVATSLSISDDSMEEKSATCSTSLVLKDVTPPGGFACTSVEVSDSTPAAGQTITANVNVYNPNSETVTYVWTDVPTTGGTYNPDDEEEVTYTLSDSASGTIELSATVTAGNTSDTCSTTLSVSGVPGGGGVEPEPPDGGGVQPGTALFSPVLYMTGGGAALAGSGFLVARSGKQISGIINKTVRTARFKSKRYEDRTLSRAASARKRVK